jgi:hypothetical protein
MLRSDAEHNFEEIATGDESWSLYAKYADFLFASAVEVVQGENRTFLPGQQ